VKREQQARGECLCSGNGFNKNSGGGEKKISHYNWKTGK